MIVVTGMPPMNTPTIHAIAMASTPTLMRLTQLTTTASTSAPTEMAARFMRRAALPEYDASLADERRLALRQERLDAFAEVGARVTGGDEVVGEPGSDAAMFGDPAYGLFRR